MNPRTFTFAFVLAAAAVVPACTDPIHDGGVKALGADSRAPGTEFHRAGQPCTVCHSSDGPAKTVFTVAGTVFAQPDKLIGLNGVLVDLVDSVGSTKQLTTNCVGNFFATPDDWNPHFPIAVRVTKGALSQTMTSAIGREGSCSNCHAAAVPVPDPFSQVPHVFVGIDDPSPPATCAANPDLSQ